MTGPVIKMSRNHHGFIMGREHRKNNGALWLSNLSAFTRGPHETGAEFRTRRGAMALMHTFSSFRSSPVVEKVREDSRMGSLFSTKAESLKLVERLFDEKKALNLFFIEIENFLAFRILYGDQMALDILETAERYLMEVVRKVLGNCQYKRVEPLEAGQFMVLCGPVGGPR